MQKIAKQNLILEEVIISKSILAQNSYFSSKFLQNIQDQLQDQERKNSAEGSSTHGVFTYFFWVLLQVFMIQTVQSGADKHGGQTNIYVSCFLMFSHVFSNFSPFAATLTTAKLPTFLMTAGAWPD